MQARFIISAVNPEQFPPEVEPEVAFLGRSNVGKSSLLNALAGAGSIAHISSRPGRTQAINFFEVEGGLRFVDLPGYGFAKVPKEIKQQWKGLIEQYLLTRKVMRLAVVLLDARRGWMDPDVELRDWLDHNRLPYMVVATKFDKLRNQKERHQSRTDLHSGYSGELLECSATTGRGVREIWQAITKLKTPQ